MPREAKILYKMLLVNGGTVKNGNECLFVVFKNQYIRYTDHIHLPFGTYTDREMAQMHERRS